MRATRVRKYLKAVVAIGGLLALFAATAGATRVVAGNLTLDLGIDFAPKTLPLANDAPIEVWGHQRLRTKDGSVPPALTHLKFEFAKDGSVETRGLPTCPRRKLIATTTERARQACPGAIVGTGFATAIIAFPEQAPISASTPVIFFNGPPVDGDPTVIVHGHLDVPAPTTYIDTFQIESIHRGSLGYRVEADLARIAGGYGSLTYFRFHLGAHWRFRGERLSFITAHCAVPGRSRLLGRSETQYADGTTLFGTFFGRCQVRKADRID
ncbi:MAG: hypothetical protein QOF85_2431 [Solirubrobacterales bacterium]|jgi:hypothetical protein|nr:hypothetical protein [Solirubrobacterales bacterium]